MRRQTSPEEEALEELRRLKARAPSGKKKRTPWVRYTAVVLLAVVCIGGAELAACRFFAPALYEELMEPVRETAHQVTAKRLSGVQAWVERWRTDVIWYNGWGL